MTFRVKSATLIILVFFKYFHPGRNEPLKKERPKWKSEYPMTEGQLRSKRDEFWDTAPAFDGRKEIWDALRAAALAAECNDLELAQAIVDGACITLPHGIKPPKYSHTRGNVRPLAITSKLSMVWISQHKYASSLIILRMMHWLFRDYCWNSYIIVTVVCDHWEWIYGQEVRAKRWDKRLC